MELLGLFIHPSHVEPSFYKSVKAFLRGRQQWRSRRWWWPWRWRWCWTWWWWRRWWTWWRILVFLSWKARHLVPEEETHRGGGVANIGGGSWRGGEGGEGGGGGVGGEAGGEPLILEANSSKHLICLEWTLQSSVSTQEKKVKGRKALTRTIYFDNIYNLFCSQKGTCMTKVLRCFRGYNKDKVLTSSFIVLLLVNNLSICGSKYFTGLFKSCSVERNREAVNVRSCRL